MFWLNIKQNFKKKKDKVSNVLLAEHLAEYWAEHSKTVVFNVRLAEHSAKALVEKHTIENDTLSNVLLTEQNIH